MYATRTIDDLGEARHSLRKLIDNGYYGAYPYYLLSITSRLAAEIYEGSEGVREGGQAAAYYEQALEWARLGQATDALDDRSVTAEAECLEQLGRFAEAIEARTRAIALATNDLHRCEGYHYRWRLYYWTGDLDAATQDVAYHAACMPGNYFYSHVYPALLLAESGDMEMALDTARDFADTAGRDAIRVIWSATLWRLLGQTEQADNWLADHQEQLEFAGASPDEESWVRALYAVCAGQAALASLDPMIEASERAWERFGMAWFHAGAMALGQGDRKTAQDRFLHAYRSFDGALDYTFHARILFVRMSAEPDWPGWIDVASTEAAASPREGTSDLSRFAKQGEKSHVPGTSS